jgi:hypothetical protein
MLTPWAINKLQHLTLDYMTISCPDGPCYGWVAVHRIGFALGLFHIIMGVLLLGVQSSKNPRASIQNGFWGPKIIAWLALIVLSFLIPESFFFVWGKYISFAGATLFLLLGLILRILGPNTVFHKSKQPTPELGDSFSSGRPWACMRLPLQ